MSFAFPARAGGSFIALNASNASRTILCSEEQRFDAAIDGSTFFALCAVTGVTELRTPQMAPSTGIQERILGWEAQAQCVVWFSLEGPQTHLRRKFAIPARRSLPCCTLALAERGFQTAFCKIILLPHLFDCVNPQSRDALKRRFETQRWAQEGWTGEMPVFSQMARCSNP